MPRPEWSFLMLPEDHREVKWALSFLRSKFTPWGQIIFGMVLVGMAISSVGTAVAGYFFVSLVCALFITASLLTACVRPRVKATRLMPPTPTAGGVTLYRVAITNGGRSPLRDLEIFDHKLPYGLYSMADHPEQKLTTEWLEPGQTVNLTVALRTPRRGSYVLEPLLAGTQFPTGLIRAVRRVSGRDPLIVFPKLTQCPRPGFALKNKFQQGGASVSSRFGQSNEFLSTRDYREGDRPRDIHWNSSARAGRLIVKEYVEEYFVRVGIFLDTELKRFEKQLCFEARISLCAGMAGDLYRDNILVDLFLSGPHSPVVKIGGGRDQMVHLMEMLAAVEGEENPDFTVSLARFKEDSEGLAGAVLFLKDWDEKRKNFAAAVKECNIPVQIVIVRDKPLTLSADTTDITVFSAAQTGFKI